MAAPTGRPGVHRRRRAWLPLLATVFGLGLIGVWVYCFVVSIRKDGLLVGQSTWVPIGSFIAADFKVHIDHVARLQVAGVDVYHKPDDWVCALYPYPPMLGRLFAWVVLFDPSTAAWVWQVVLAVILAAGALAAWWTRREMGIDSIPAPLIVAATLFCTPAVFAVERGQADPMVILPMIVAAWLLGRGAWAQVTAGGLLGLTAWIKYFPGLVVVALFALGKRKALAAFAVVAVSIGIVDLEGVRESIRQGTFAQALMTGPNPSVHPMQHSLVGCWKALEIVKGWEPLQKVPGTLVGAVLLLPAIVSVSRKVARSADSQALTYPYLLWLTSVATFGMPYANDYNLATLPIAAMAVWDRRDRAIVHLAIILSILWSQPFWLPIGGEIVLAIKLGALYAVGASLAARASRVADPEQAGSGLFRPAFARADGSRSKAVAISGETGPGSRRS